MEMNRRTIPLFMFLLLPFVGKAAYAGPQTRPAPRSAPQFAPISAELTGVRGSDFVLLDDDRRHDSQDAGAQDAQDREQEKKDREEELRDREQEQKDREQEALDRESDLYDDGTDALDEGNYEAAVQRFGDAAKLNGPRADAALYWKAYAENKLGRRADALATVATLRQKYPKSRWLKDASALDVEVRQSAGQSVHPEAQSDEQLKLLAINGLGQTDPEKAVPMLEKFLQGTASPKLKQQALFVLCQIGTPEAREAVSRMARGASNPQLQKKAIQDLGLFGGPESHKTLAEIYTTSNDVEVKRQILQSFMIGGDRDRLLAAAKGEKSPELRKVAVQQLGVIGAQEELWQLYQNEASVEVKKQILQAMFVGGGTNRLLELAKREKDPELRRNAIRNLGLLGAGRTGDALVGIYESDRDRDDRREVINALFIEGNAHALIQVARKETDPELKKDAVQKLSLMHSKEATDFLMEILNH